MADRGLNYTQSANSTGDQVISSRPCILHGVYPQLTTTGTITMTDHASATGTGDFRLAAIGLTQQGTTFGNKGIFLKKGLTIKQSVGTDITLYVWESV